MVYFKIFKKFSFRVNTNTSSHKPSTIPTFLSQNFLKLQPIPVIQPKKSDYARLTSVFNSNITSTTSSVNSMIKQHEVFKNNHSIYDTSIIKKNLPKNYSFANDKPIGASSLDIYGKYLNSRLVTFDKVETSTAKAGYLHNILDDFIELVDEIIESLIPPVVPEQVRVNK